MKSIGNGALNLEKPLKVEFRNLKKKVIEN